MNDEAIEIKWNLIQKILFRFFFVFSLQLMIPGVLVDNICEPIVRWIGHYIFRINYNCSNIANGSGDSTAAYLKVFLYFSNAFIACFFWSILDRKRNSYSRLFYFLRIFIRYYLAQYLLLYGYAKILKFQFPPPDLRRLSETYGESSPMGLAWTFLGFSNAFNYFMGFFEAIGGVLLLFRRTTLLGACIACTVMVNVVLINFCYDVPVKLFSCQLLLFILFILSEDAKRLLYFFILNRDLAAKNDQPVFQKKFWKVTRIIIKVGFIALFTGFGIYEWWGDEKEKQKSDFCGVYSVDAFDLGNEKLTDANLKWKTVTIFSENSAAVRFVNDSIEAFYIAFDTLQTHALILTMTSEHDDSRHLKFSAIKKGDSILLLESNWNFEMLSIRLRRNDAKNNLLMTRGFHWINEQPFNR